VPTGAPRVVPFRFTPAYRTAGLPFRGTQGRGDVTVGDGELSAPVRALGSANPNQECQGR